MEEVEDEDDVRERNPIPEPTSSSKTGSANLLYWKKPSTQSGILGPTIPFKSSQQFFVPRSGNLEGGPSRVPGQPLPNPLLGMATSRAYDLTDSISQAPQSLVPPPRRARNLSDMPEMDEASFHSQY
ncbi:hypothetical protein K438DRAFT_1760138 [Mycena galopus ATCC 62051]|nr:hypothetical protein K438DRAFT_1760138 [Mycena galopus ATCC 62051]